MDGVQPLYSHVELFIIRSRIKEKCFELFFRGMYKYIAYNRLLTSWCISIAKSLC